MKLGPLLRSEVWSRRGKLRLLLEPFARGRCGANETVTEFICRRLGREVLDKAIAPYVTGLLASNPDLANAREVLPRLVALEQRYGSIALGIVAHRILRRRSSTATEAFTFTNGMETLVRALAAAPGVSLRREHCAVHIEPAADGWAVTARTVSGCRTAVARHVVVSTPAAEAAALLQGASASLASLLSGIGYAPVVIVHTGFERGHVGHPLDGNGFLLPRGDDNTLNGCLWMSSLFPRHAPAGRVLFSNYFGGTTSPAALDWSPDELVGRATAKLRPLLGLSGEPEFVNIVRHARGLPLYHGAYHEHMKALSRELAALSRIHIAANYRGGISVRDRIACSASLANRILRDLASPTGKMHSLPSLRPPTRVATTT